LSWVLREESWDASIFPSGSRLTELITFSFFTLSVEEDLLSDDFLQLLLNRVRADNKNKAIRKWFTFKDMRGRGSLI